MGVRKQYDYKNSRLPDFTNRFRKIVDEIGGVTKTSEITGISRPTINFWYNGQRTPDAENLRTLSESFHIRADWFLGLTPNRTVDEDIAVAEKTTGLSESAIKKLQQFRNSHYGEAVGDAVVFGGDKAIVLISLVNDLIEAEDFKKFFTDIAGFLVYGGAFPSDEHISPDDGLNDYEVKRAKRYFRANGKEVVLKGDASELCLQLATEKLKTIFRNVLQKEKAKNDSNKSIPHT